MTTSIPQHIAVIMDGNGRWAKERGLPRVSGHQAGVESVDEIVTACRELGVQYLTLYSLSKENWRRPRGEISFLMDLLSVYLRDRLDKMQANGVRFNYIGTITDLPENIQKQLENTKKLTEKNSALTLTLALSYGSRQEISDAAQELCRSVQNGKLRVEEITPEIFKQFLYTRALPDPDLVIRTSGENRMSNFLLWQSSYAEFYVSTKWWPDFRRSDLELAICEFSKRERRFGATPVAKS
ncbi:MAG: isoprenyl transferase [Candidatus Omnitrophica bacterium]|nr:isoprenyl transferase [Candidatus Omnitrophota bacterium]